MPVYEYVCSRCGPFESWDYGLTIHLVCGGSVERVFVPPAVGRVGGAGGSPARPSGRTFRADRCCDGGCDCE